MNIKETARVLGEIALYDNRKIDPITIAAWHRTIGHLAYTDTSRAVVEYFTESTEYLKPADLIRRVKAMRDERLAAGPLPAPTAEDPDAYIQQLKHITRRVADGTMAPLAIGADAGAEAWDTPTVRRIRARFDAEQEAARRRKAEERQAERTATRAYIDAQETLLALDDLGESAVATAWEELFGEEQAAAGFPLAQDAPGMNDQQKTTIRAAQITKEASS